MAEVVGVHLVGSAPVEEPDQLFDLVSAHLRHHVRRVPDGEVGERDTWIRWQYPKLGQCPQLEPKVVDGAYQGRELAQYVVKEGAGALELVDLGYADAALGSHEPFEAARAAGTIAEDVRFMVGLPTPLGVVTVYVAPEARDQVLDAWLPAMKGQLERILDGIPHEDLAIQWEVALELGILEGLWPFMGTGAIGDAAKPGVGEHIVHLGNLVPEPVELGYHLCYGDLGHEHFTQPADAGYLAWAAAALLDGVQRPIQWIHLPVPRERDDLEYFEPLTQLDVPESTELYLGLVHETGVRCGNRVRSRHCVEGRGPLVRRARGAGLGVGRSRASRPFSISTPRSQPRGRPDRPTPGVSRGCRPSRCQLLVASQKASTSWIRNSGVLASTVNAQPPSGSAKATE